MSVQAIEWVLEQAPDVPAHLVAPLMGLANHADRDGRGAFPSRDTLCWYTRKEERAIRRDLDALEELGLIRHGDQRFVLHLPVDRRPVVWDLAMERSRQPRPARKGPGRPRKDPVETPAENGGVCTTPHFSKDSPDTERGGLQDKSGGSTRQIGGVCTPPEPSFEPSLNPPPTPPHDPVALDDEAVTGGGGDPNEEPPPVEQTGADLTELVAEVCALQPGWRPDDIRAGLIEAVAQGRTRAAATVAILALARGDHGPTRSSPRQRLLSDGPHWAAPAPPIPQRVADRSAARCRLHRGELAGTCSPCRGEALANDSDTPTRAIAAADARALIRQATAKAAERSRATVKKPAGRIAA